MCTTNALKAFGTLNSWGSLYVLYFLLLYDKTTDCLIISFLLLLHVKNVFQAFQLYNILTIISVYNLKSVVLFYVNMQSR